MLDAFFIVGFVRSGSTALAEAFKCAAAAEVHVETAPKLLVEARQMLEGRLEDPARMLRDARSPLIESCRQRGVTFADKNASYMPFIPWLAGDIWNSKIVYFRRDGRDAVRSLMDWHSFKAKNIYIADEDVAGGVPQNPASDPWGYFYLRPTPGDPVFAEWKGMSRFEKCAWYWAEYNRQALASLSKLASDRWIEIDLSATGSQLDRMAEIFSFLELEGFDAQEVGARLNGRINSLAHRLGIENKFPAWPDWDESLSASFDRYAGDMTRKLGY